MSTNRNFIYRVLAAACVLSMLAAGCADDAARAAQAAQRAAQQQAAEAAQAAQRAAQQQAAEAAQAAQRAAQQQAAEAAQAAQRAAQQRAAEAAQIKHQLSMRARPHQASLGKELATQMHNQLDNEHLVGIAKEILCLHMETYLEQARWPSEEEIAASVAAYAPKFILKKLDTRPVGVKARQAAFAVIEELKRDGFQNTDTLLAGVKLYCEVS